MSRCLRLVTTLLIALSGCGRPDPEALAQCHETTGGELTIDGIQLHTGSRVEGSVVTPGRVPRCEDDARALSAFDAVRRARAQLPQELAPTAITLHFDPVGARPLGVEFHEPTGSLLAERHPRVALHETVWLHELVHVRSRGARPGALAARRLYRAIEEGTADYVAAVIAGSPQLGRNLAGSVARDLRSPPEKTTREWSMLGLPQAPFDAHTLGWQLAAELYRRAPKSHAVATDLVAALARRDRMDQVQTPAQALAELQRRCPERSRATVTAAVRSWVFPELRGE